MPPPTPHGSPPTPRTLRFGFSPCPNDTFAFWAAVHEAIPAPFALAPELADIEALNERAVADRDPLPVTKLSLPAFARVADRYAILAAGAALGFGCGPLVVCRDASPLRSLADLATGRARVAIPGTHTTANLLLAVLGPAPGAAATRGPTLQPMRFDQVMGAVARGDCDAGVIIHESRFTYRDHGLRALADLGELWERTTATPLPLGVIAARRDLPAATVRDLTTLLRTSVTTARAAPDRPRAYVRANSRELSDAVCDQHIALYVNDFTVDLGERGRAAITALLERGHAAGLLPRVPSPFHDTP